MNVRTLGSRYRSWYRTFPKYQANPTLERMERLLALLGNPQEDLPARIQIVGTNGKGSTGAYLQSCLQAAGYRVGVYSSPAFVTESEQIRFHTTFLPHDVFEQQLRLLEPAANELEKHFGERPTRFELTTVLACLLFKAWNVDVALFEAGMGGRYDSTTALSCPLVALTNVSEDHKAVLGQTVREIAQKKAGAVSEKTKSVVTTAEGEGLAVLSDRASSLGVPLVQPRGFFCDDFAYEGMTCQILTPMRAYRDLFSRLVGMHQVKNLGLALTVLEKASRLFDLSVSEVDVRLGCENVTFPGRFQIVDPNAFREPLPQPSHLILDGAHNKDGMRRLLGSLLALDPAAPLAVFATKNDVVDGLVELAQRCEQVYLPNISFAPFFKDPNTLIVRLPVPLRNKCVRTSSLDEALFVAAQRGQDEIRDVLVTGSLYFLGALFAAEPGLLPPRYKEAPLRTLLSSPKLS